MKVYAVQFSGSFVDQAQGLVDHQMSRIEESVALIRSSAKHWPTARPARSTKSRETPNVFGLQILQAYNIPKSLGIQILTSRVMQS